MQCPTSIEHCCGFSPLLNSKGCRAFGLVLSLLAPGCQLQYSLLLTESKTTLHPNCSTAVDCRVFKRSKDFECFLRWGKRSCQSCKHPSRRTSKGACPAEFHLPRLAKTSQDLPGFHSICRYLSAFVGSGHSGSWW